MARNRTGKFWWEYNSPHYITLESLRGENDWALLADCRCFDNYAGIVRPWIALSSLENWGDDAMTPGGFPDGDTLDPEIIRIPFEDRLACDILGSPYRWHDSEENDAEPTFEEIMEQRRKIKELRELCPWLEDDEEILSSPQWFRLPDREINPRMVYRFRKLT